MLVIGWIVLGFLTGLAASAAINSGGRGMLTNIVLGIVGAVVAGLIFNFFGAAGVTGFNFWSLIVAIVGAVVVLWFYHALAGRKPGSVE
ncbi:putative membrane protein YeaQ/YmgE (transglycosylase-associated protein family) [Mesorhizobium soli]|uniref:GlsB/YeaQ/YmgE family stress response membrane protein n=1 Tax=Pseudaminobacter soli (ex Li et al. 2025) TaxID=1295366 RepID=UPI002473E608|nr:GlsB/YeaQ/YmgE family stress response membrane protein [Mesorhizobium soli]MDH6231948.1 putative membrane protein YeaQ/YmgE (transglycosylase-associated protein family) [Mesorhizobium soli]